MDLPDKSTSEFIKECNDRADARVALLMASNKTGDELNEYSKKVGNKRLHMIFKILCAIVVILILIYIILQKMFAID